MSKTVPLYGFGGGGAALNFKLLDGLTQPSSASENTIWVKTNAKISSYVFSAVAPAEPVEGMVWIQTGTESKTPFNALKKNNLTVYPGTVKQHISGEWERKEASIYQDGAWIEFLFGMFYSNGAFFCDVSEKKTPDTAVITYNTSDISLSTVGGKVSESYVVIGPVDLANFSTLKATGTFILRTDTGTTNVATLFVAPRADCSYTNATAIKSLVYNTAAEAGYVYNLELDVSDLSGDYYIYAGVNTQGSAWALARTNTITEISGE